MSIFSCMSKPPLYLDLLGDEAHTGDPKAVQLFRKGKQLEYKKGGEAKALALFKQAAELNLAAAQTEYGIYLLDTDRGEGRVWLQRAADKNNELARDYLNMLNTLNDNDPLLTSVRSGNKVTFVVGFPGS